MITDLRFLKGNWEFGKYKLQMDKGMGWVDVPFEEEPKKANKTTTELLMELHGYTESKKDRSPKKRDLL